MLNSVTEETKIVVRSLKGNMSGRTVSLGDFLENNPELNSSQIQEIILCLLNRTNYVRNNIMITRV